MMENKPAQKRFYMSESSLYGLTVYDRIYQTPAFQYGAESNMREFNAITLCSKLNGTLGRTIHMINNKYPELMEDDIREVKERVLQAVTDRYRIASDAIEQIISDVLADKRKYAQEV